MAFANAGTNPRFTNVVFSTMEYYDASVTPITQGTIDLRVKSDAELSALPSPPSSPFTVTADRHVTMTNDEGQTATGTIRIETTYARTAAAPTPAHPSAPGAQPTFKQATAVLTARVGEYLGLSAETLFDNAGTGANITAVVFSPTDYYHSESGVRPGGTLLVRVKTAAELNALPSPPDSPFTVTAEVTMTNDEGQTATGTIEFQTTYDRTPTPAPTPAPPSDEPPAQPTFSQTAALTVNAGGAWLLPAEALFDFAGTNPKITSAVFSPTEYHHADSGVSDDGMLFFSVKTAAELNALTPPPTAPSRSRPR